MQSSNPVSIVESSSCAVVRGVTAMIGIVAVFESHTIKQIVAYIMMYVLTKNLLVLPTTGIAFVASLEIT